MYADITQAINALITKEPSAIANMFGNRFFPSIYGRALFYPVASGTLVAIHVLGLPHKSGLCNKTFYGMHIHNGGNCSGTIADPYADVGEHYNPTNCEHPTHAGDLPPLLGNDGEALSIFFVNSFSPEDIIGHTLIIHELSDDLQSAPSGNSGMKIACGEIIAFPPAS